MSHNNIFQIEKLDENNYGIWSIQMKSILVHSELWNIVCENKKRPTENFHEYDTLNEKALAVIILSVKPSQLNHIKNCKTSVSAWNKLKEIHIPKGAARKTLLFKKLLYMSMAENEKVVDHLHKFCEVYDQLDEAGITLPDEVRAIILLSSLPKSFENFVVIIETRDNLPKFENIKIKLLEEAERRKQTDQYVESSETQQAFGAKSNPITDTQRRKYNERTTPRENPNRPKGKCFTCGKVGHFAKNCRTQKQNGNSSLSVVATLDETCLNKNKWYVDSGATSHMSNNRDWFINMEKCWEKIELAGNQYIRAVGKGDVKIRSKNEIITLKNVLYAPTLKGNFISVSKATSKGGIVIFGNKCASIKKNGKIILEAKLNKNLYEFENYKMLNKCYFTKNASIAQWHSRYGHLNYQTLTEMAKKELVNGIKVDGFKYNNCQVCMKSKISCKPFPKYSENRSENVLDTIHSDLCGPFEISLGGSKYFLTFIDDKSRKIFVYFIKNKNETFQKFKEFKALVEKSTGLEIKKLRTDNGGEYVNKEFDDFLITNGIERQLTVPYTPQQNGVAERANRTLVEMARSMLLNANCNKNLWAEAISTAVYLRNRSSSRSINNKTPYEVWSGKKPAVGHLRVFGAVAVGLNKQQKSKFDQKGETYMMVGYSLKSKAYRLYDVVKKKVVEKRDVIFDETKMLNEQEENKVILEIIIETPEKVRINDSQIKAENIEEISSNHNDEESYESCEETDEINETPSLQNQEPEMDYSDQKTTQNFHLPPKRIAGRPRIIRTGKPGRPRKEYNILNQLKSEVEVPNTVNEALKCEYSNEWKQSMQKEYDALLENETWKMVDLPPGKKAIGCKWVFALKSDKNGHIQRFKSRLVAKGCNQKYNVDYKETFSPVVRYSTIRMIIALACEYNLYLHQLDVTSAYLNGNLHEDVFMKQPEGFIDKNFPNKVLKLQKSLYGLKQSGREWNIKLDEVLKKLGFEACPSEPCVYIKNENNRMNIIAVYVDDIILACSNKDDMNQIKFQIGSNFKVTDGEELSYILGMEIDREGELGAINIGQGQYIDDLLEKTNMQDCKPMETPLEALFKVDCKNDNCTKVDATKYKSIIGALLYLAITTRPDILHSVIKLSQRNVDPHTEHEVGVKRILRYLKATRDLKLHFKRNGKPIECYVDADWAGEASDRKSFTGYVFMAAGGAFSWESKKQNVVALSSTEAEYIALSSAAKEAIFIKKLLQEMGFKNMDKMILNGDNQSAQHLVRNPKYHPRSKHIDIKYHHIRDLYKSKIIDLNYVSTESMTADVLTKNLQKIKHKKFVKDFIKYLNSL